MTTLLLSEIFPPKTGGSGRWFWEIYRRLPRDRFLIAAGEDARQEQFDSTHDLDLVRLPLSMTAWGIRSWPGLKSYTRTVRQLRRLARQRNIGRLHCGRCLPEGVMALALKYWTGLPYVCYCHGEDISTALNSREHALLVRQVLKNAEQVVANSHNTCQLLLGKWSVPASKISVLHPGVDIGRFVPQPRSAEVRRRLGWNDRPVVLTVGRLQKRKGHDQLIRALLQIRHAVPRVLYSVVGDGEQRHELESLVDQTRLRDHVIFHGEIPDEDLIRCFQQCDVFALPNREIHGDIEGFGMVLLEAQACGKPVIAGTSGGTAETMRIPHTGRVVPCDGPYWLAKAITELLTDGELCRSMGQLGRQWTVERFSWDALSQQAAEIFGTPTAASRQPLGPMTPLPVEFTPAMHSELA